MQKKLLLTIKIPEEENPEGGIAILAYIRDGKIKINPMPSENFKLISVEEITINGEVEY